MGDIMSLVVEPKVYVDVLTGELTGGRVTESTRTIGGLQGYFLDETVRMAMDQSSPAYRVQAFEPEKEGTPGAICLATTTLYAGMVGDEYFLTRGHFHVNEDRPELEVTVNGTGFLVLMDATGKTWTESMSAGSVHHVPPATAHRVANIGVEPLVFISYWPSETGHDYAPIAERGFGIRVRQVDGKPTVVRS